MKSKLTLGAIIVAIGAALVFWLGGFTSGKDKVTPEKLPVDATAGIYGNRPETADIWPVWSIQVAWRSTSSPDIYGPVTHQIQLQTKPTLADVEKYIPPPAYLAKRYKPLAVFNIVQIGPQLPVETPDKK